MLDFRMSPGRWQPPVWPLWALIICLLVGIFSVLTGYTGY